jgi:hypothetical protein
MFRVLSMVLVLGLAALVVGCGGTSTNPATSPSSPASPTITAASPSPTATPAVGSSLTFQQTRDLADGAALLTQFFGLIDAGQYATAEKMLAGPSVWDKSDLERITSLRVVSITALRINPDGSMLFSTDIRRTPQSQAGGPYFPNFATVARDAQGRLVITSLATSP